MPDTDYESHPHIKIIYDIAKKTLSSINTMLPARINSYDSSTGFATVTPLVKLQLDSYNAEGKYNSVEIPPISQVPVMFFGNQESKVLVNIKKGDRGILLFSQKSLDEWKASFQSTGDTVYSPSNKRKFNINDAIFFPSYLAGNTAKFIGINSESNVTLKTPTSTIGTENAGTKVVIKGITTDVGELLENLQDQITMNQRSLEAIAGSNPFTAPSLSVVVANNIASTITSKINYIRKVASFGGASVLAGLFLKLVALRADGSLQKQLPITQTSDDPPIVVAMKFGRVLYPTVGNFNIDTLYSWGWVLSGVGGFTTLTGAGDANFSPLSNLHEDYGKLVGCVLTPPETTTSQSLLSLVFSEQISNPLVIHRVVASLKNPASDEYSSSDDIMSFDISNSLPALSYSSGTKQGLYSMNTRNVLTSTYNKQISYLDDSGFAVFSDNFKSPILYLRFLDSKGESLGVKVNEI